MKNMKKLTAVLCVILICATLLSIAADATRSTLRKGDKGSEVKALQQMLNQVIAPDKPLAVDSSFGTDTYKRVKAYQEAVGITKDGVVGPITWEKLENSCNLVAKIKKSNCNYPSTLSQGKAFTIKGTVTAPSGSTISKITVGPYTRTEVKTGSYTTYVYAQTSVARTLKPNTNSVNIKDSFNSIIRFGNLDKGTYYYRIVVTLNTGEEACILNKKFTVK